MVVEINQLPQKIPNNNPPLQFYLRPLLNLFQVACPTLYIDALKTILRRGFAKQLLKSFGEIGEVIKTHLIGNFGYIPGFIF